MSTNISIWITPQPQFDYVIYERSLIGMRYFHDKILLMECAKTPRGGWGRKIGGRLYFLKNIFLVGDGDRRPKKWGLGWR